MQKSLGGCGWFWVVSGGFGWFRVVCCFSSYQLTTLKPEKISVCIAFSKRFLFQNPKYNRKNLSKTDSRKQQMVFLSNYLSYSKLYFKINFEYMGTNHISIIYLHSKSAILILRKKTWSHFLLTKNLPNHIFAWNKKSFSWNSHRKNFFMLSKNLLDWKKIFPYFKTSHIFLTNNLLA